MNANAPAAGKDIAPPEQCRRDELRAQYKEFEFRVPATSRVLITNVSYGEEQKDDHRYVVTVEDGFVADCTCPHKQHRNVRCKHILAIEERKAVIMGDSVEQEDR